MTTSEQQAVPVAQEVKDDRLWCLHVTGMDDVHPAPNRATAQLWATQFTVDQQRRHPSPHPYDPVMNFTVAEWPWSAERHTAGLAHSVEQNTWPVDPLGSYTSTSQRSADNFNTAMKYTDGPRETLPCKSGEGAGEVVTDETPCICCCRARSEHTRGQCPETTYFIANVAALTLDATQTREAEGVSVDDARAALFHLEVFAEGEDSKRIRVVIDALSRLTGIKQAARRVLDDIDDCRSANASVAALRAALNARGGA